MDSIVRFFTIWLLNQTEKNTCFVLHGIRTSNLIKPNKRNVSYIPHFSSGTRCKILQGKKKRKEKKKKNDI